MKQRLAAAALAGLGALVACGPKPESGIKAFAPPTGRRAFSLAVDGGQTRFLEPGDAVEVMLLAETLPPDGRREARPEILAPRAEVLRMRRGWAEDAGLVQLALSPEEAQYAALAADREDPVLLNKLPAGARGLAPAAAAPPGPVLGPGRRGLSVLVYADQAEFLRAGDRADVIAAREPARASGKAELTALTLLQDVLVLGAGAPEGNDEWASVQLELTPGQASALARAVGAEDGLSLVARAPGDRATRPVEPARMSRRLGTAAERGSPRS
ncbi:MAG: hypothetical protein HY552_05880 [Elusimicrobia bacterium]|nr:hypothetical protein [Elusimicrobiota bacterium]